MPEPAHHPAELPDDRLIAQCEAHFLRRSGPGGQHRNKVATAVILRHLPTGIQAEANERRSQAENRAAALFRLRVRLALRVRIIRGASDVPSMLWQSRSRGGRIAINAAHADFPALLAEALDSLAACDFDPVRAGTTLRCTASQIVKLLRKEPQAFVLVNEDRVRRGLHPLR